MTIHPAPASAPARTARVLSGAATILALVLSAVAFGPAPQASASKVVVDGDVHVQTTGPMVVGHEMSISVGGLVLRPKAVGFGGLEAGPIPSADAPTQRVEVTYSLYRFDGDGSDPDQTVVVSRQTLSKVLTVSGPDLVRADFPQLNYVGMAEAGRYKAAYSIAWYDAETDELLEDGVVLPSGAEDSACATVVFSCTASADGVRI